jgi:hypothetical protein
VIAHGGGRARVRSQLGGYAARRFPFRVWWVRDYGAMSPGELVALVHAARAVEPDGRLPEWLYLRRVVSAADGAAPDPHVVPSRSNTRRPSASHFAMPASRSPCARSADDDVADAVAAQERGAPRRRCRGTSARTSAARVPASCAHCSSWPAQPSTVGRPVKVEMRAWPNSE